ncbi:YqgE/AlgH family protein [Alteromonas oceanisediminis]|uniref:YqgE/AlgH family protein n=1 Tax=Alteromonas oceanisediminis TaxID=2836180 RepID=UPI001BDAF5E6|nr:YqgE/AlgH family protein [Alteromonas oceanisediminis]MBT0585497.1 YqgE/AlgH family protein [Alteromonas oceanisediminis]
MTTFENHFLIAMPTLDDPYFSRSLTYICEHNAEGAMGLVINQPTTLSLAALLEQIDESLPVEDDYADTIVLAGGPVAQDRGFILHTNQPGWSSSLQLTPEIMVTTSKDILPALATSAGPDKSIITLGYAGWTAGQLEQEIQENSWLTVEADLDILFNTPIHKRWQAAVNKLGVDIWQLAPNVGHA